MKRERIRGRGQMDDMWGGDEMNDVEMEYNGQDKIEGGIK